MKIPIVIFVTFLFSVATYLDWPRDEGMLTVTMLDVGQGDAIHVRTPNGTDLLIDGGPDRRVVNELGRTMPPQDHTIEFVLATHPDADHIAGVPEVAEVYTINTLITNGVPKETSYANAVDALEPMNVHAGQSIQLEDGVTLDFLHPDPTNFHGDAYNDDSLVFILRYNDFSMLFTGDIGESVEREIAADHAASLDVNILKVAHHGSKTSTASALLEATTPDVALISVGAENRFGHPHAGSLFRLEQASIPVLRTDTQGRITCASDGTTFVCQPQR
jgi:competence protein ComEC